jgi:hypothetical protein
VHSLTLSVGVVELRFKSGITDEITQRSVHCRHSSPSVIFIGLLLHELIAAIHDCYSLLHDTRYNI